MPPSPALARLSLAVRHRLPAIYPFRVFSAHGGLIYGPDQADLFRRGASYVDRVFSRARSQASFRSSNRLKVFGLEVPAPMLARADEVIE
jgi:hypothetical protein